MPWPLELEDGVRVFHSLAGKCIGFQIADPALAWMPFNFRFGQALEVERALRLAVLGKADMDYWVLAKGAGPYSPCPLIR